jgi:hypothetical protein
MVGLFAGKLFAGALFKGKLFGSDLVSTSKSRANREYQSVEWTIDWQQPVITKVERLLGKKVEQKKQTRDTKRPSVYLDYLLYELQKLIDSLDLEVVDLESAMKISSKMQSYDTLWTKLNKVTKKQKQKEIMPEEDDDIVFLVLAYQNYFAT